MTMILTATLALSLRLLSPQDALFEDFDARGSSWADTIFPHLHLLGGTSASRETLGLGQGAPDTDPPLPINAGGDQEARFFEASVPGASSFALAANEPASVFRDGSIRAAVAFGVTSSFGSQDVGLLLRASINPSAPAGGGLNGYTALVLRSSAPHGAFALARWRDGVITDDEVLAFGEFAIDGRPQNYVIEFQVEGTRLTAALWRVTASAGRLWTEPVVVSGGSGPSGNRLSAQDGAIVAGRSGVSAFTRSSNSVFLDEILVKRRDPGRLGGTRSFPFNTQPWLRWAPWTFVTSSAGLSVR